MVILPNSCTLKLTLYIDISFQLREEDISQDTLRLQRSLEQFHTLTNIKIKIKHMGKIVVLNKNGIECAQKEKKKI